MNSKQHQQPVKQTNSVEILISSQGLKLTINSNFNSLSYTIFKFPVLINDGIASHITFTQYQQSI